MKLEHILNKYDIKIYFQPIVSTVNKKIIGYEALTRGFKQDLVISPVHLFEEVRTLNLTFEFDKYVRTLAIKKFVPYYEEDKDLLLFLNFESSLIDEELNFDDFDFYNICKIEKVPPSNIVLEIREDKIENSKKLKNFTTFYKNRGFNIALDDFGMGGSTFDRLSLVKPDIVKVDRSIVHNIHYNFIHSEVLKAISKMCNKIGAIVLAEGVEQDDEILKCLKTDISIYQGFYFSTPQDKIENEYDKIAQKISDISTLNAKMIKEHKEKKESLLYHTNNYSNYVIEKIKTMNLEDFSCNKIKEFLNQELKLEAMYLIDYHTAKQIGETIISGETKKFFQPAQHGDSHYLKEYYYITKTSKEQTFISQKYISNATGNMCRTFAKCFCHDEKDYILCLDILV